MNSPLIDELGNEPLVDVGKALVGAHITGIANDGFPIYGDKDINGSAVGLDQLDACNGITSAHGQNVNKSTGGSATPPVNFRFDHPPDRAEIVRDSKQVVIVIRSIL